MLLLAPGTGKHSDKTIVITKMKMNNLCPYIDWALFVKIVKVLRNPSLASDCTYWKKHDGYLYYLDPNKMEERPCTKLLNTLLPTSPSNNSTPAVLEPLPAVSTVDASPSLEDQVETPPPNPTWEVIEDYMEDCPGNVRVNRVALDIARDTELLDGLERQIYGSEGWVKASDERSRALQQHHDCGHVPKDKHVKRAK